jgi:hypothetical protein
MDSDNPNARIHKTSTQEVNIEPIFTRNSPIDSEILTHRGTTHKRLCMSNHDLRTILAGALVPCCISSQGVSHCQPLPFGFDHLANLLHGQHRAANERFMSVNR